MRVLVLNGPNLNMLGVREPAIYGHETLDEIGAACSAHGEKHDLEIDFRHSNSEGELVTWIQEARHSANGIIINPAGYTHSSVSIMDALVLTDLPVVEIHLSNIHRREAFRTHSYISFAADGVICGLGAHGYLLAIDAMAKLIATRGKS